MSWSVVPPKTGYDQTWVEVRLEAKTACVFLCQTVTSDIRKKPGYTDAFWVSILLMVEMILNKNKNKYIF